MVLASVFLLTKNSYSLVSVSFPDSIMLSLLAAENV
jgi:hypothetical protein